MQTSWSELKRIANQKGLSIQWVIIGDNYHLAVVDGSFTLECAFSTSREDADVVDFEDNFKSIGNRPLAMSPYANKTIGPDRLYKRITGIQADVVVGENSILYEIAYDHVKITEIGLVGCAALETVSFFVLDSDSGTYSGVPGKVLNQFAFNVNTKEGFFSYESQYDADLYKYMKIKVVYVATSDKRIGINFGLDEVKR